MHVRREGCSVLAVFRERKGHGSRLRVMKSSMVVTKSGGRWPISICGVWVSVVEKVSLKRSARSWEPDVHGLKMGLHGIWHETLNATALKDVDQELGVKRVCPSMAACPAIMKEGRKTNTHARYVVNSA